MGLPEEDRGMSERRTKRFVGSTWFYLALASPNVPVMIEDALRGQVWWACFAAFAMGVLLALAYATRLERGR